MTSLGHVIVWRMKHKKRNKHKSCEHGGHDQSQVKIKFKKFEKVKSVPMTYQKVIMMTDTCSRHGKYFPQLQCIPGIFWCCRMTPGARGSWGKVIPTVAAPGNILMPWNGARCQGDGIPTVAAPRSLPDQTEILVCCPDSHWSPIPANYPYWECRWA